MLRVQTYTASDPGFAVNSHLIMGEKDAILVDAQFTRSEARKVVEMVRTSGKSLKAIFITHSHPDHFLGLEVLTREFPHVKVVATKNVVDSIRKSGQGYIIKWKPVYKDDFADNIVLPEVLANEDELSVEGEKIQVVELDAGESDHAAALFIPSLKTFVAGDALYNHVHLWLVENRIEGWLNNLEKIGTIGNVDRVLPGHGEPTDNKVIEINKKYIQDFVQATSPPATRDDALNKIREKYSDYRLPVIAELSVSARIS
jgi:glyoxylase-like metal-dependent hydrolase (beta-lactamase superfamily II)